MTQCFVQLPNRGLIHLEGPDRHEFLQNLITNDMSALAPGKLLYACLLTPQGKFLHDFFISEGKDFTLLECEGGGRAQDLYKRLTMYRLRADVQISVEENIPVYAILSSRLKPGSGDPNQPDSGLRRNDTPGYPDPRHPDMGNRSFEKPDDLPEKPFETWDTHRIRLAIPDGSRDMVPERSAMQESNIDTLNGLSYDKGCYVGQEPTARVHYRGLVKKHLYAVEGENLPAFGEDIRTTDGKRIGEMRSSCGNLGLALLKDSEIGLLKGTVIRAAGT